MVGASTNLSLLRGARKAEPNCRKVKTKAAGGGTRSTYGAADTSLRSTRFACLGFLGFAFQGALQRLIQRGFCAFVFLLADDALFVFDFELEDFFFQGLEQH